jgi:predicted nucleic acid-binding protein
MTSSLVDSNVLIDLLSTDPIHAEWSFRQLDRLSREGNLVVNQIVFAEVAMYFPRYEEFERGLASFGVVKDDLPWAAAAKAGLAHRAYRKNGGMRERVLSDFLIGAHADEKRMRVLTRDGSRYRTYFPTVEVIAPETHP